MFARSCLEEGEEGRFTANKLSDSSPHQPRPHFYLEIEKDSLIRSRLLGSYNVGVVEHEAPADEGDPHDAPADLRLRRLQNVLPSGEY